MDENIRHSLSFCAILFTFFRGKKAAKYRGKFNALAFNFFAIFCTNDQNGRPRPILDRVIHVSLLPKIQRNGKRLCTKI